MTARDWRTKGWAAALALVMVMVAAASATAFAYWPGLMTWDAIRQYGQALDGDFDDWHPPAMEWLWRQLLPIASGPAPMLLLQLLLYWSGFALLAGWALRERRHGVAVALVACGLLPFSLALMGAVLKDCLMAGALLSATGLMVWSGVGVRASTRAVLRAVGIALLLFAATLRFNAFLACLPLLVALLPVSLRRSPLRLAASSILATIALMAAMPLANRLIGAQRSGVELSLIIFDLGGITEHSGSNVFPPLGVADPVAGNHLCYSPVKWDPYSDWVDPPCPLGFKPFRAAIAARGASPYRMWAAAILAHPLAYAEHRLSHFNINTRFLVPDEVELAGHKTERPVQVESAPNDWHLQVRPNRVLTFIDAAALASARTPAGWPMLWLALALGVLILSPRLPSRRLTVPIALSAFAYGMGYLAFSVASELRYHLWTMIGTAIALVLTAGDLRGRTVSGRHLGWALLPAGAVFVLATIWRA